MSEAVSRERLFAASSALVLDWARLALPHYGAAGSMDADLADFPDAAGPSYYNQFAHWPMLLLAEGLIPGADPDERQRFRECALGNIEYMLGITGSDFMTPHYSRGRDWGRHVGEWSNIYLLRSWQVLREQGSAPAGLLERLERSIRGATARIAAAYSTCCTAEGSRIREFPGNHATWHALLCYLAGKEFAEPAWVELGEHYMRTHVLPFQEAHGSWPEGGGIVVNYAMVTAQAVSIYAEASGDREAQRAVARFLSFARTCSFADGSSSVAMDCRMRYSSRPMIMLPPTWVRIPEGREEAMRRIEGFHGAFPQMGATSLGVQGLAFFCNFPAALLANPELADGELACEPIEGLPGDRLDVGPWTAFLSWQLNRENRSRFLLDVQNFVELYHQDSGYLVGGGNSKYMPRFSTIRRCNAGRAYVPDAATRVECEDGVLAAVYQYGEDRIEVSLRPDGDGVAVAFRLLAAASADTHYECALMLAVQPNESIQLGERVLTVDPRALIEHDFGGNGGQFRWRDRLFEVPAGSVLSYSVMPHNPYRQDGLAEAGQYAARLYAPVSSEGCCFRIS